MSTSGRGAVSALLVGGLAAAAGGQVWEVGNVALVAEPGQAGAGFGHAVAIGDFDDDGEPEIAVGAPFWDTAASADAGRVFLFRRGPGRAWTAWDVLESDQDSDDGFGYALAAGDFDHDGRDELAIGRPLHEVVSGGVVVDAGAVTIARWTGTAWDLSQTLTQLDTVAETEPETDDRFGEVLEAGQLGSDLFDDLVVGVPSEDWLGDVDAGVVQVFYGSTIGLSTADAQTFVAGEDLLGVRGAGDRLGAALARGDFNLDFRIDLAVGAPGRAVGAAPEAGEVHVVYADASGRLGPDGNRLIGDDMLGVRVAETGDRFGAALEGGDFDAHFPTACFPPPASVCADELAIGIPGQAVATPAGTQDDAGQVVVLRGSLGGPSLAGYQTLDQNGLAGSDPEAGDHFGAAFVGGTFNGRPIGDAGRTAPDLAIAAPDEDAAAGVLHLVMGGFGALGSYPDQAVDQRPGFGVAPGEAGERFGFSMASDWLDEDPFGDLVVGVPGESPGGLAGAGAVQVLYGALFADGTESGALGNWSNAAPARGE